MRKVIAFLVAISTLLIGGLPAQANAELTISAPTSIDYNPAVGGFSVSGITISNPPAYLQVGLTIVDNNGVQVPASDRYRVAVGDPCNQDSIWYNPATYWSISISGDNSTNVIVSGTADNISEFLKSVWIYANSSSFCARGNASNFGNNLTNRKLQVTAIESQQGLMWSPSTHHYYQLATQTTSDGMGQPTNDDGYITDESRYFVRWSTARAEAKASSITIGGQTRRGYLASITTADEFSFLNDNVTGGTGVLYPAWVGGSDAGAEGTWKWVDGPEALKFGGDLLTEPVQFDPEGRDLKRTIWGDYYIQFGSSWSWYSDYQYALLMRDSDGNLVQDPTTSYNIAANFDQGGPYCQNFWNNGYQYDADAALNDYRLNGPEIDYTGYGSRVQCNLDDYGYLKPVMISDNGMSFDWQNHVVFHLENNGNFSIEPNGNYLAIRPFTSDMYYSSLTMPNFRGATFWGSLGAADPVGDYDPCNGRGSRGICREQQEDVSGHLLSNDYFVYWSNGDGNNQANWDGTGYKPGDGVYSPQPDNAHGNDSDGTNGSHGEAALIINWCERNPGDFSASTAPAQSLYGNPGYRCTPGWNDLPAFDWSRASTVYTGADYDTPNQIGTTDYVIEYCGYDDEGGNCDAPPTALSTTTFNPVTDACPESGSPQLSVSYSAPNVDSTDLSTTSMVTETFDSMPAGGWLAEQMTNVGYMSGSTAAFQSGVLSGSGGVGNFISAADTTFTLPSTQCYIGFWWSAGNASNYVDLQDAAGNVIASFDASDLVNALGGCPNPYCGNPNQNYANGNELYAYVHMRLPTGFQKVHFYGSGFELDTISISVQVPGRASNETNLSGPAAMGLTAPDVLPVDPLATSLNLPALQLTGDANASLCFIQVADAEGTPLENSWLTYSVPESDPVTLQPVGSYLVLSGATSDVMMSSGHMVIGKNDQTALVPAQSSYLRVYAVAGQSPDSASCASGTSKIIEIRPFGIDLTQVFDIPITDHSN